MVNNIMANIKEVVWGTSISGYFGIVVCEEDGVLVMRGGVINGDNAISDAAFIADWGSQVDVVHLKKMVDMVINQKQ